MSHSQFHSTNLFILRHAWLNLWDKHMTTGRINQVTTFHSLSNERFTLNTLNASAHFLEWEFINSIKLIIKISSKTTRTVQKKTEGRFADSHIQKSLFKRMRLSNHEPTTQHSSLQIGTFKVKYHLKPHLVPRSHKFWDHISLLWKNKDQVSRRELPTTGIRNNILLRSRGGFSNG